jgi:O-antigen ligase
MTRLARLFFPQPPALGLTFLLLVLLVAGLPLAVIPAATDSFVLSKEILFNGAVALLLALSVGAASTGGEWKVYLTPLNGLVLLFLAWTGLSITWSASPALAKEEFHRLLWQVLFFLLVQNVIGGRRERLLALVYTLGIGTLVVAVLVLVADFRQAFLPGSIMVRQVLGDWRDALSTVALGNTSHLGDLLCFGFILWAGGALLLRGRIQVAIALVALWLHAAGLIVVWSVHSNVSLIMASVLFGWLLRDHVGFPELLRRKRRWIALIAGWVLVVAFYTVDHPLNPHGSAVWGPRVAAAGVEVSRPSGGIFSEAFSSPRWTSGLDTRLAIWYTTLEIVRTHPWIGVGAGNFVYTYPATTSPIVQANPKLAPYGSSWTNAAHNELLQFWAELGIIGPALLILVVGAAMKEYWDRLKERPTPGNAVFLAGGLSALTAICLQAQMNFPLQLPVSSMLFFVLLAVPTILPKKSGEEPVLMVPVERPYGPVTLGVTMKNMAYPTDLKVYASIPRPAGVAILLVALAVAGVALVPISSPLRADIVYRPVYEGRRAVRAGGPSAAMDALLAASRDVLGIWPGHVDCRSGYQQLLLDAGKYDEVIAQTPLVLEKLNSTEVYERRAVALTATGSGTEATSDWDEVFRRRPDYGAAYPGPFNEFLERQESRKPASR